MKDFNYHRPATPADAVKLIKKTRSGKFLAGGMTLLPTMKQGLATPSDVVDLSRIRNAGVTTSANKVTVKAGTPHADVASNPAVRRAIPALAELAHSIGDPHVRHRGTIGGSIANNDPAADYPAALVGLGATVITNTRKLPAEKFFTGMFTTALKRDEIVTAVEFPVPKRAAYSKFPNPASRYAMVGVFVSQDKAGKV
jgi:carbon-monoxide dehydrogenase medium subunit